MKKLLPILLLLGVAGLSLQVIVQFMIKYHEVDYSIITKDNSYLINEKLNVVGKKNKYSFKVVDNNKDTYYFNFEHNYNGQDKIIKNVKFFNTNGLKCIYPVYKGKKTSDIYCNYNDVQTSYTYLKQTDNKDFDEFIKELKKEKYTAASWKSNSNTLPTQDVNYKFYLDNVPKKTFFTVWFYRGFYILENGKFEKKEFLTADHYENNLSSFVGNYYVSINTDMNSANEYTTFYLYDVVDGGKGRVDLNEHISFNMYINGAYDGKFYYTDLDKKKQFALNPDKETVEEVGNVKDGFKNISGKKLINVLAKDYLKENRTWTNVVTNNVLKEKYGATMVQKDNDMYYFVTDNGDFYKVFKTDLDRALLLFHFDSVSEWKVKDSNIMIISGDTMYYYNDVVGLSPIVSSSEFKYNYKNICDFVVKQ